MSDVLSSAQRRALDTAVQRARVVAEAAAAEELGRLGVAVREKPSYLSEEDAALRRGLRAKAKQLGDELDTRDADLRLLQADVAYEQWHRLLFARFLAENSLLRHPEHGVAITLDECAELAASESEPDGWMLAARYASRILPGVFRLADPAVQVRYSPERRGELERIVEDLDADVFRTEDALGWVYQFWQTAEKKRVNEAGSKIGGADLSPVTQLFTENYMVRFLLENSLGAWWAARHPDSPLVAGWEYLRHLDDGTPAAGTFEEWPTTAGEVTLMDPCCGSGHFLVAAFGMLWRMRAEEEGLSAAEAQDAVLRDNLFGLELDPRCTQIATFNVVFEAWKQGGYRPLPAPQIACSGIPVRAPRDEWEALAGDDAELRSAMGSLHTLFRDADTLGSLINPRPSTDDGVLMGPDLQMADAWGRIGALLRGAVDREGPAEGVTGDSAVEVARAARLLSATYTLVATNPPYLMHGAMEAPLQMHIDANYRDAKADIATAFMERSFTFVDAGSVAIVSPQNWLLLKSYERFRRTLLSDRRIDMIARLGSGAFRQISGEVVKVSLAVISGNPAVRSHDIAGVFAHRTEGADAKAQSLRSSDVALAKQSGQARNPEGRLTLTVINSKVLLDAAAIVIKGNTTGDDPRFRRSHWELPRVRDGYRPVQSSPSLPQAYSGLSDVVNFDAMTKPIQPGVELRSESLWGRRGVVVHLMSSLRATIGTGAITDQNVATVIPHNPDELPAIWAYCSSAVFGENVREIDDSIKVTNATLGKVPFDLEQWKQAAHELGPLPELHSADPTQWIFRGEVRGAIEPLQVAVARLLGYRWPGQQLDALDGLADADGIVAMSSLGGELDAATRLRGLLARAYGAEWSSGLEQRLVVEAGGKTGVLEDWLRDTFFAHHCKLFQQRPFLWQIWDGLKDGFSAIVNYHRLDNATLSKLTFSTLGGWIERQKSDAGAEVPGASERLRAALELQRRLRLILDGEPDYDVYVRWKPMHEQPIGWHPDLDDGVRLNIRPFVTAEVLHSGAKLQQKIRWEKDRGKNPDGSERHNDLHPSLEDRRAARAAAGVWT